MMFVQSRIKLAITVAVGLIALLASAGSLPEAASAALIDPAHASRLGAEKVSSTVRQARVVDYLTTSIPPFAEANGVIVQQGGLAASMAAIKHGGRAVQVNLARHPKISQYADIDSSAQGYGPNACALVAAAAALGGKDWVPLVGRIANAAGSDYGQATGIQPSDYAAALQAVFGGKNVTARNQSSLDELYRELQKGNIVIVDIKVNASREAPAADGPTYAHFARVLGIDRGRQQIYIENTLSGSAYWTLSLNEFAQVWEHPETSASLMPDPANAEAVTRWAVILNKSAQMLGDSKI